MSSILEKKNKKKTQGKLVMHLEKMSIRYLLLSLSFCAEFSETGEGFTGPRVPERLLKIKIRNRARVR